MRENGEQQQEAANARYCFVEIMRYNPITYTT